MNLDFFELYKAYSNVELLKITRHPADYQPGAVVAATSILEKRDVSANDLQEVDEYFEDIKSGSKKRQEIIDNYKEKASDFLQPVLNPDEEIKPHKWLKIFLLAIAIQYLWTLYTTIKYFIDLYNCSDCRFSGTSYLNIVTLIYIPLIFLLLYARSKWGWILLFFDNFFAVITRVSSLYFFFKYQRFHHGDTGSFLFSLFVKSAFVYFLYRDEIASYFEVNRKIKIRTAIATVAIVLLTLVSYY